MERDHLLLKVKVEYGDEASKKYVKIEGLKSDGTCVGRLYH